MLREGHHVMEYGPVIITPNMEKVRRALADGITGQEPAHLVIELGPVSWMPSLRRR